MRPIQQYRHLCSLGFTTACFVLIFDCPVIAQEYCRLETPTVVSNQINVKISCQTDSDSQSVRYPIGPLFIGVSLYTLDAEPVASVTEFSDYRRGSPELHLEAQQIKRPAASTELVFRMPSKVTQTHFLVAVWDKKNACASKEEPRCQPFGYTLGKVDKNLLPVPVDAWPRPVCDVAKLRTRGFFAWSAKEGADIQLYEIPKQFETLYLTNDCWMYDPTWPGRGVSLRRWRAAPLPRK